MKIQELKTGTDLMLEIVWSGSSYEIPTKIVLSMVGRIFIQSFSYKGKTLDLENPAFRGMSFNIYANSEENGVRLMWRSVGLEMRTVRGNVYYEVRTNAFSAESQPSERRDATRIRIGISGAMCIPSESREADVEIYDFSRDGIAFTSKEEFHIVGGMIRVRFEESIRDHLFQISVDARCVRKKEGETFLYGCHIRTMDDEAIAYLTQKTLDIQMEALEAQRRAAAQKEISDGPVGTGESILEMGAGADRVK